MISFKNATHAVACFFKAVAKDTPLVIAKVEQGIGVVEKDKAVIEGVSAVAAGAVGGAAAVSATITVEDAGFAALASLVTALQAGGAAAAQKLLDAGLDQTAIDAAKAAASASQAVYTVAKAQTQAK